MPKRSEEKREFWRVAIEMQRESGLSVSKFCEREDLKVATFFAWRKKLEVEARQQAAGRSVDDLCGATPQFAEVSVLPDAESVEQPMMEFVTPSGVVVRMREDVGVANLRAVLSAMQF